MRYTLLALLIVTLHVSTSAALDGSQIAHELGSILSSDSIVYLPSDTDWTSKTTQRFNSWNAPTYLVSVKPAFTKDIQIVVKYAAQKNISFLTTGGGHGYSGSLGALHDGISLDMGNFNRVRIDAGNNILTVGGSVKFNDVMGPVYAAGKAIPVGSCPCVGMVGASLGGGIGFYSGIYGAISDSIVSLDVVTADGSLKIASDSKNRDLFWAMKGAGSSFGAVISISYKLYDFENRGQVMNADMAFTATQNGSIWEYAKSWVGKQPKDLSITIAARFNPTLQQLLIVANIIYVGPLKEGIDIIKPLLDLSPQKTNISYVPWKEVPAIASYGVAARACLGRTTLIPHSLNLYEVDVEALGAAIDFLNETLATTPALQTFLITFNQYATHGFQLHDKKSSAFPYRDVVFYTLIDGIVSNPEDALIIERFGSTFRNLLHKSSGKEHLSVYTHFAHGDEGAKAWFSEANIPKLRALKQKYDPDSLFSFYNSVWKD